MSFDILGKDIAVLFILAVIFGVATYFYVLHKGKKERRTVSTENKIILGFEVLYTQDTFITSNIPITIYPVDKTAKCEIWLPLSSHVGVLFSENKKYKRNHLINRTEKTESLNCLVANNANLYYQKTALLIGNNKRCLTKAYDIVSSPHFRLSDL